MKPERLLKLFDQVAEAPDAVARLRRLVLDLAIGGKLVEQISVEGTGTTLFEKIRRNRTGDIAAGKINQPKMIFQSKFGNPILCQLPASWKLAKLGELFDFQYGEGLTKKDRDGTGDIPVYGSNGITGYHSKALTNTPAIIVGRKGSVGALNIANGPSWTTDVAYFVVPPEGIIIQFAFLMLKTAGLQELGKGVKPGLSRSEAYALYVPLPPTAEQHRIVQRVDELMALCNQLEAAQANREQCRNRLSAAALDRLVNTESGEKRHEVVRFYLNRLPRLVRKVEHVQALRQVILDLAVQGRLAHSDSSTESASAFIKQVQQERQRLISEGRLKAVRLSTEIPPEEYPFIIPNNWLWAHLDRVFLSITDGDHQAPPRDTTGMPFIVIGNLVGKKDIDFRNTRFVRSDYYYSLDLSKKPTKDDLLYTVTGATLGIAVPVSTSRPFCVQRHIAILKSSSYSIPAFFRYALNSNFVFNQAVSCTTGTAQKTIPISGLRKLCLPIPPIEEQRRIVAKVDQLSSICDQLEDTLQTSQQATSRLLDALIAEALSDSPDPETVEVETQFALSD